MLGSDFNAVKELDEMCGSYSRNKTIEMENFQVFINLMNLIDLLVSGNKFTWVKVDGRVCSRLDKFLIS